MLEINEHIIDFSKFCPTCEYRDTAESDWPCSECIEQTVGYGTIEPDYYKLALQPAFGGRRRSGS